MIQVKEQFQIVADDSVASAKFSLKEENLAHVFNILRNNLYSDKILAVIREYSTNAADAQVEAGRGELPIHVTLPTTIEPTFQIRDFGHGLSEYDVFNVFSSYGASTKRNTNELIGTLGMGSKSGFAYQSSFTITSYHAGKKSIYEAYIDETDLGTMSLLHEEESNEPSGLQITIAVHKDDIYKFKEKAIAFYAWFEPVPVFHGMNITAEVSRNKFEGYNVIYQSDSCVLYKSNSYYNTNTKILVNMGNTCYPITDFDNIDVDWMRNCTLVIKVKLGEVTFTTSRESLEMKKITLDTINRYLEEIKKTFVDKIQVDIDACATPWEAICKYNKLDDLQKKMVPTIIFDGKTLDFKKIQALQYTTYDRNKKQWKQCNDRPWQYNNAGIILNDGGFPTSHTAVRLTESKSTLEAGGSTNVFYVKTLSVDSAKEISEFLEFEGLDFVMLSSVSAKVVKSYTKSAFTNEKHFKWNGTTSFPYSGCWTAVVPDPNKVCVYVEIDNFRPVGSCFHGDSKRNWSWLYRIKEELNNYGKKDFELYGIRKSQKSSLPSNWISLENYLLGILKEILADQTYINEKVSTKIHEKLKTNWFMGCVMNNNYESVKDSVECPVFKEVLEIPNSFTKQEFKVKDDMIHAIRSTLSVDKMLEDFHAKINSMIAPKVEDINTKVEYCVENYPLVNGFEDSTNYYNSYARIGNKAAKSLVDYANILYRSTTQQQMTVA
jgi:hypothetical protein